MSHKLEALLELSSIQHQQRLSHVYATKIIRADWTLWIGWSICNMYLRIKKEVVGPSTTDH